MYIHTPRLLLRDFVSEDADDLQEILGDAETMTFCEPPYTPEQTKQFLSSFCIGRKGAVAAVHRDSGKLIGYLLFSAISDGVYEMGWFFHRGFWRQGYAYEACAAVIDYAFRALKAHKIFAETIDGVKSVGLMEKLGMSREGVQASHVKNPQGVWTDLYLYGILAEQYLPPKFSEKA